MLLIRVILTYEAPCATDKSQTSRNDVDIDGSDTYGSPEKQIEAEVLNDSQPPPFKLPELSTVFPTYTLDAEEMKQNPPLHC